MKTPDLQRLLAAYRPKDPIEKSHLERLTEHLSLGEKAFSPDTFDPGHFTASAFLLSPCGHELGLIFHGKLKRWLQPGGHFSPADQTVEQAAKRELLEETCVQEVALWRPGLFDVDIHPIPENHKKNEPAHLHFDLRFAFQASTRDARAGSDAKDFKWVPLSSISKTDSDASVLRAAHKFTQT